MNQCLTHEGKEKEGYATRAEAEMVVLEAKIARALHNSNKRRECRSYRCPNCGKYHTTSKGFEGSDTTSTARMVLSQV